MVPETLPLPELLEQLRSSHRQIACVVDEYGGFAGVVSFEDIAEEVVGVPPSAKVTTVTGGVPSPA